MTQDKLIRGLNNLLAALNPPDHRRQEIISFAVECLIENGTVEWQAGWDKGYDDALTGPK